MISQVEGEAFAQKYLGVTDNIKRECFAPTGFQEMWVRHSLVGEGRLLPLPSQGRGLGVRFFAPLKSKFPKM
jgi:hypothetical protein